MEALAVDFLLAGVFDPRGRFGTASSQGDRRSHDGTVGIVPSGTATETGDLVDILQAVDIDCEVVADVARDVDHFTSAELHSAVSIVASVVVFVKDERIFQYILVSVEAVGTDTDLEDQVFESEFILDITSSVDRLAGGHGTSIELVAIFVNHSLGEEVIEGRTFAPTVLSTVVGIAVVGNVEATVTGQFVGREHADVEAAFDVAFILPFSS